MARPTSFTETVQLAKQAEANHAKTRTTQPFFKQQTSQPNTFSQPKPNTYNYTKTPFPNPANRNPNPSQTVSRQRTLTSNEIMERRRKGLCFHCDEKYGNGHVCKMKLYMLSGEGEERENNNEVMSEEVGEGDTEVTEEDCHISIQAISGGMSHSTIKVKGEIKKQTITILIDSGATHNFIDPTTLNKLGLEEEYTTPLSVTGADGNDLSYFPLVKLVC